jgi:hypothetical protein
MKKVFLSLLIRSTIQFAHANGWVTEDGSAVIQSINIEGGRVRVWYTASNIKDPDACENNGAVILDNNEKNGDRHYAAILAAYASGKSVKFYTTGCFSAWGKKWPILYSMTVTD